MDEKPKQVGYKRPPEEHRFRPGQSGNPSGRPKGSGSFKKELLEELGEITEIQQGDETHKVSNFRAIIKMLVASARAGNHRAIDTLMRMCVNTRTIDDQPEREEEDREILDAFPSPTSEPSQPKRNPSNPNGD